MDNNQNYSNSSTPRENFLMALLTKVINEYKALLEFTRRSKPLKIVEITHLSIVPGETKFAVQVANKHCVLSLTAAEIILNGHESACMHNHQAQITLGHGYDKIHASHYFRFELHRNK